MSVIEAVSLPARERSRPGHSGAWLLAPALLWMAVFFGIPLVQLIYTSFFTPDLSLKNYTRLFADPVYVRVLATTFEIGLITTAVALVLGYPVALAMIASPRMAPLIMACIMLPLLTSILVRTYGWMVLLGRRGVVNEMLMTLGITDEPMRLLYNRTGALVGMVHVLLPFMIMPLYSVMRGIDTTLLRAAQNLGATERQAFFRVYVPLTLPGVASGCLLVFIMAIGFMVTPALLGGRSDVMIATLIYNQVQEVLNWGMASALAVMLLVSTAIILAVYQRWLGVDRLWDANQ
jgi:putative spermidine/putrescine transport system permease protein